MNISKSLRIGMVAGTLTLLAVGAGWGASSSTVVLDTGYRESGQPVSGAALTPGGPGATGAVGAALDAPGTAPARNQPADAANPAGSELDAALMTPGTLVVAPGAASAPRATAQGPATLPDLATPSMLFPALMALVAMAPLVGWLVVSRRRRPRTARHSHRALAEALAANVAAVEPAPAKANAFGAGRSPRRSERPVESAPRAASRDDIRRELDEALRRGPDAAPVSEGADLDRLRSEVLEGLREMKARVTEFTEALETGKAELQSELGRAHRAVELLRRERDEFEQAVRLSRRNSRDDLADTYVADPTPAPPAAFRPPRIEAVRPAPKPAPTLDPAWMLLDDEGDSVWMPPTTNYPLAVGASGAPRNGATDPGSAFRRAPVAVATEEDPRERRRRIVDMARNGRTIDDISRELRVGRGEVTLALSRAR